MSTAGLTVERAAWDDIDDRVRADMLAVGLASRRPCPFFAPEFIDAYVQHNERYARRESEPFVFLVRRPSGELVGALPLKRVRNHDLGGYHQIEFVVATEVDIPVPMCAPEHEHDVAAALAPELAHLVREAAAVHLINQPAESPIHQAVSSANTPWYCRIQHDSGMPICSIPVRHESIADYFADLSKRMRSNVSRLGRRLAAEGHLELLSSHDAGPLDDLFTVYLDTEDRSWKRGTEASLRRHPERVAMYRALHASASAVVHHVDILALDGVAVAGLVSIQFGPTLFLMETSYDDGCAALSPSNLLILLSVDRAIRGGLAEVSLHGHFDYYKHRWLAESVPTSEVRLVRRGSTPDIRSTLGNLRRRFEPTDVEQGVPNGQRTNDSAMPSSQVADVVERLRADARVTRLDTSQLAKRLPFDLTSP